MAIHKLADYIMSRDDWKKKRDGAPYNVPKSAVSGVSIGDSIAAVYKSFALDTAEKNLKDAEKLCTNLDTYSKKVKVKHAKFATDIVDKLLKKAKQHKDVMADVVSALKQKDQKLADAGYAFRQHVADATKHPLKGVADKFNALKGVLDCMGLIDDGSVAVAREAGSWVTKCENVKVLSDKDKKDIEAFLKKAAA